MIVRTTLVCLYGPCNLTSPRLIKSATTRVIHDYRRELCNHLNRIAQRQLLSSTSYHSTPRLLCGPWPETLNCLNQTKLRHRLSKYTTLKRMSSISPHFIGFQAMLVCESTANHLDLRRRPKVQRLRRWLRQAKNKKWHKRVKSGQTSFCTVHENRHSNEFGALCARKCAPCERCAEGPQESA